MKIASMEQTRNIKLIKFTEKAHAGLSTK